LVLAAPSILTVTRIPASAIESWLQGYGWTAEVQGVRFGWLTPLEVGPVKLVGPSHQTSLSFEKLRTERTLSSLIFAATDYGQLHASGVDAEVVVYPGSSSLERDLEAFQSAEGGTASPRWSILVESSNIRLIDGVTKRRWQFGDTTANVSSNGGDDPRPWVIALQSTVAGPRSTGGEVNAELTIHQSSAWHFRADINQLPLDLMTLAARRGDMSGAPWETCQGWAQGSVNFEGDQTLRATFSPLTISHFQLESMDGVGAATSAPLIRLQRFELAGKATYAAGFLAGEPLEFRSDIGQGKILGSIATTGATSTASWSAWLQGWSGEAELQLDLPMLTVAAPRVMRLRPDAQIRSGNVRLAMNRSPGAFDAPLQVRLDTDEVEAQAAIGPLRLAPLHGQFTVRPSGESIAIEGAHLESAFATLEGHGDPRSGNLKFKVELQKLGELLAPISELDATALQGSAEGSLVWMVTPDSRWQAEAEVNSQQLRIAPGGDVWFDEPALQLIGSARGQWQVDHLGRLEAAEARLQQTDQAWRLELIAPVDQPTWDGPFQLSSTGTGDLSALLRAARAWVPTQFEQLAGRYTASLRFSGGRREAQLESMQIELVNPSGIAGGSAWSQPEMRLDFRGALAWPAGEVRIEQVTLQSSAISLAGQGRGTLNEQGQLELALRGDLGELQKLLQPSTASTNGSPIPSPLLAQGQLTGRLQVQREATQVAVNLAIDGQQCRLLGPSAVSPGGGFVGPVRPVANASYPLEVVWEEPKLQLAGTLTADASTGSWSAEGLRFSTAWCETNLSGAGQTTTAGTQANLSGPLRLELEQLSRRAARWLGTPMSFAGNEESPVKIAIDTSPASARRWQVESKLSWQQATIGGLQLGPAQLPLRVTENYVALGKTAIEVQGGRCEFGGELHYQPMPRWIQLTPGLRADDIQLSEVMARSWLKYIAPIAADATGISGRASIELDEGYLLPDQPEQSRVVGRMHIAEARLGPGPLAQQLLLLAKQIDDLVDGKMPDATTTAASTAPWIELPTQTVDFRVEQGVVAHDRMVFQAGDVVFYTGGRVSFDGRLAMTAQVPIQAEWVAKQPLLQSLAGAPLVIPISGTFSRPAVDSQQLANSWSRLGTQALQGAAQNLLERELQRGIGRLLGTPQQR
jgi:hypothetical protein